MERIGLTPITDYRQVYLQPATTDVAPLQPLQPGELPVLVDPVTTGYANPVYAAALQQYTTQKSAALNEARQAQEAAAAAVVHSEAANQNMKAAAIGAGVVMLAIKFLL